MRLDFDWITLQVCNFFLLFSYPLRVPIITVYIPNTFIRQGAVFALLLKETCYSNNRKNEEVSPIILFITISLVYRIKLQSFLFFIVKV